MMNGNIQYKTNQKTKDIVHVTNMYETQYKQVHTLL